MNIRISFFCLIGLFILGACSAPPQTDSTAEEATDSSVDTGLVVIEAGSFLDSSKEVDATESGVSFDEDGWLSYDVTVPEAGRFMVSVSASASEEGASVWLEDYIDNTDGRTYNVTGSIAIPANGVIASGSVDGTPLNAGLHKMKVHVGAGVTLEKVTLSMMKAKVETPTTMTQNLEGDEWVIAWADEFDGETIDTEKWTYDLGDWGWGNNELQYYTVENTDNARIEDGYLVIEARKNDTGDGWTSARLTTREKTSFLYGKIEFKAKVPRERGNWAAGWTLGDTYVDEKSWPYCGEIDIMESVGYEVNDETGDGIAHVTVHTPAYYFKIGNQISNTKDIVDIADEFHTYGVEWTPTEVKGFVDGEEYYLYDKTANELEWPFNIPQNIILNLAMGGGWGGAQGMDPNITSQKLIIDYVRVYEKG
ncbi:MAG: family 16 glycosylhydrolase [Bacteroidota bacterium]